VNALPAVLLLGAAAVSGHGDLRTASGEAYSLAELLAHGPAVLVLWNSWLPHADEFARLLPEVEAAAKRNGWPGAVVVFQEEKAEAARRLLGSEEALPIVFDRRGELVRRFKVTRAPTVLLVERDGEVRARSGPEAAGVRQVLKEMERR
jgi:thiol-disulfide isomerase/thioredoxin